MSFLHMYTHFFVFYVVCVYIGNFFVSYTQLSITLISAVSQIGCFIELYQFSYDLLGCELPFNQLTVNSSLSYICLNFPLYVTANYQSDLCVYSRLVCLIVSFTLQNYGQLLQV